MSKSIKIKWRVTEVATGRYRSFSKRGWPSGDYPDGRPAFHVTCADDYVPRRVKAGEHAELTLRIADYSQASPERGAFEWRQIKRRYATLPEAKTAAARVINGCLNYMAPPEYRR